MRFFPCQNQEKDCQDFIARLIELASIHFLQTSKKLPDALKFRRMNACTANISTVYVLLQQVFNLAFDPKGPMNLAERFNTAVLNYTPTSTAKLEQELRTVFSALKGTSKLTENSLLLLEKIVKELTPVDLTALDTEANKCLSLVTVSC